MSGGIFFGSECNKLREVSEVIESAGEDNGYHRWRSVANSASDTSASGYGRASLAAGKEPRGEYPIAVDTGGMRGISWTDAKRDRCCEDGDFRSVDLNHHKTTDV